MQRCCDGHDDGVRFNREASRVQDNAGDDVQDAVLTLQPGANAPSVARSFVAEHRGLLADEVIEDAQLLVSEVVANAVQHGRPAVVLRVRSSPPGIGIAVADAGDAMPQHARNEPHRPAPDATSGRGLAIVAALASAWGVIDAVPLPGKTVWFELNAAAAAD